MAEPVTPAQRADKFARAFSESTGIETHRVSSDANGVTLLLSPGGNNQQTTLMVDNVFNPLRDSADLKGKVTFSEGKDRKIESSTDSPIAKRNQIIVYIPNKNDPQSDGQIIDALQKNSENLKYNIGHIVPKKLSSIDLPESVKLSFSEANHDFSQPAPATITASSPSENFRA